MRPFAVSALAALALAGFSTGLAAQSAFINNIDRDVSFALLACDLEARGGPRVIFLQTASDIDRIGRDPTVVSRVEDQACAPVLGALLRAGLEIRDAHDFGLRPEGAQSRRKAIVWELVADVR